MNCAECGNTLEEIPCRQCHGMGGWYDGDEGQFVTHKDCGGTGVLPVLCECTLQGTEDHSTTKGKRRYDPDVLDWLD